LGWARGVSLLYLNCQRQWTTGGDVVPPQGLVKSFFFETLVEVVGGSRFYRFRQLYKIILKKSAL
jgi:hypothetical protein